MIMGPLAPPARVARPLTGLGLPTIIRRGRGAVLRQTMPRRAPTKYFTEAQRGDQPWNASANSSLVLTTRNDKRPVPARMMRPTRSASRTRTTFHTVSAFFLAGTAPDERQARMDAFQRRLPDFHDRDMIVVGLAVGSNNE